MYINFGFRKLLEEFQVELLNKSQVELLKKFLVGISGNTSGEVIHISGKLVEKSQMKSQIKLLEKCPGEISVFNLGESLGGIAGETNFTFI